MTTTLTNLDDLKTHLSVVLNAAVDSGLIESAAITMVLPESEGFVSENFAAYPELGSDAAEIYARLADSIEGLTEGVSVNMITDALIAKLAGQE